MPSSRNFAAATALLFILGTGIAAKKDDPAPTPDSSAQPAPAATPKEKGTDKGKDRTKDRSKDKDKGGKGEKADKSEKGDKGDKSNKGQGEMADGNAATDTKQPFNLPLVPGQPSKGLKIPYGPVDKPQMMFYIGEALRLDNDHVQFGNMQVQTFDENGDDDITVNLPTSVFDMNTRVLTGHTDTHIKSADYVITGDNVEFNVETKKGKLTGHVHMTIYDLNATANAGADEPKAAPNEPKAAPTKAP